MTKTKNRGAKRIATLIAALFCVIALVMSLTACVSTTTKYGMDEKDTEITFVARIISQNENYHTYKSDTSS